MSRQDRFGHILGALHAAVPGAAHWPRCSARIEEACATYGNILTVACGQTPEDVDIDLAPLHFRVLVGRMGVFGRCERLVSRALEMYRFGRVCPPSNMMGPT